MATNVSGIKTEERPIENQNRIAIVKTQTTSNYSGTDLENAWCKIHPSIVKEQYTDDTWTVLHPLRDKKMIIDFPPDTSYALLLRKFAVLRLSSGLDSSSEASRLHFLSSFLLDTEYFDLNYLDDVIYGDTAVTASGASEIIAFIDFAEINTPYRDELLKIRSQDNTRIIPSFYSILLFDKLMERYITNDMENNLYQIVVLWWELTKVIPMRPIEFFTLKKDCLIEHGNGTKSIKIHRAKVKATKHAIPIKEEIPISDYQYTLFKDFINVHKGTYKNSEYLFNTEIFKKEYPHSKIDRDFIGRTQLYAIFNNFFDEIISGKYGYTVIPKQELVELKDDEIERFSVGDTRHLAFLNMLLQNVDPVHIAQMGGHTTVNQQLHYLRHLNIFLQSKAYALSKRFETAFHDLNYGFDISGIINTTELQKQGKDIKAIRKIDCGYCTSEDFPYDCEASSCLLCKYCQISNEISTKQIIQEYKDKAIFELNTLSEYLSKIVNTPAKYNIGNGEKATIINKINVTTSELAVINAREQQIRNMNSIEEVENNV